MNTSLTFRALITLQLDQLGEMLPIKPIVTTKVKIDVVDEIRKALTPTQRSIFEKTCFGHWPKKNSQLLIHTLLTCMVDGKANKLSFLILDNPFRNRMFHHIEAKHSVKLNDVMVIFDKMCDRSVDVEGNDIWILEAILATHRYVHKQPTEKIPRALAWESTQPFTWSRCCTLFVRDQLAPPLETLTPTKGESETDWWKAFIEYFE
nr:hypothetical protein [Tanacetum cinerariifolium]